MRLRGIAVIAAVTICLVASGRASAGHGHGGTRFSLGLNFSPGPYYAYPAYAYPAYAYPYPYAYPPPYYYAPPAPVYRYGYAPPAVAAQPAAPQPALANTPATPQPSLNEAPATTQPSLAARPASSTAVVSPGSIEVRLPEAQGEVWIDGQKVGGSGANRTFRERSSQESHVYKITAVWHENGRLVTEERLVESTPGQRTTVDFNEAAETASAPATPRPFPAR